MNFLPASGHHLAALKAAIANRQKTSSVSLETAPVREDTLSRVQAASTSAARLPDLKRATVAGQKPAARPVPLTAGSSLNASAVHLQRPVARKHLVKNNLAATTLKNTVRTGRKTTPSLQAETTLPSSDRTRPLTTKTMLTTQKENVAEPSMTPKNTAQSGPTTTPTTTPAPTPLQVEAAVAVVEVAVATRTPTTRAPDPNSQQCPPPPPSAEPS
jgi:hypothetical protein